MSRINEIVRQALDTFGNDKDAAVDAAVAQILEDSDLTMEVLADAVRRALTVAEGVNAVKRVIDMGAPI